MTGSPEKLFKGRSLAVGLVLGFGWLHSGGFVAGIFGGLVVFQMIEIGGVLAAAKRQVLPIRCSENAGTWPKGGNYA